MENEVKGKKRGGKEMGQTEEGKERRKSEGKRRNFVQLFFLLGKTLRFSKHRAEQCAKACLRQMSVGGDPEWYYQLHLPLLTPTVDIGAYK